MVDKRKNASGMTFEVEEYEPGNIDMAKEEGIDAYDLPMERGLTMQHYTVLQEYAKDLDLTRACSVAGYSHPQVAASRLKKKPHLRAEMRKVEEVYGKNIIEMTAERGSARFLKLMDKFERDYDDLPKVTEKGESTIAGQLAGALARMGSDYLKATGHFSEQTTEADNISITINMHGEGDVEVDKDGNKAKITSKKDE